MAIDVQGLIDHLQEHVRLNPAVADTEVHGGYQFTVRALSGDFDIIPREQAVNFGGNAKTGIIILDMG